MGKIGFVNYDKPAEEKNPQQAEGGGKNKNRLHNPNVQFFSEALRAKYVPFGSTTNVVYLSTEELIYSVRDSCDICKSAAIATLFALGYKVEYIDGKALWRLYEYS